MSDSPDRNIEAIAKIISLTREDRLEWRTGDAEHLKDRYPEESRFSSVFVCQYDSKWLRVFRRAYMSERMRGATGFFSKEDPLEKIKVNRAEVVLEIVDDEMKSLWQFPKEEILQDLLKVIKYKVSGADDLISKLLSEP